MPEAATYLGCNRKLLKRMMDDGRLPAYRLGTRLIRIKVTDLEALLTPLPVRTGK